MNCRSRWFGPMQRSVFALLALLVVAQNAEAWKVTTHMVAAERGAKEVKDDALRALLLANLDFLRGGAVGPDIFYFPSSNLSFIPQKLTGYHYDPAFSDLAHYCQTDELARNMIDSAKSDREKAFAYGWLAHNLEDSVAHPWVNGFVGAPFRIGATLNWSQHGKLEGWVNKNVLEASDLPDTAIYRAITLSYSDPEIQALMVRAYAATYGGGKGAGRCIARDPSAGKEG